MSIHSPQPDQPPRGLRLARSGFTLVELIISLAIIAVLIAILLPAIRNTVLSSRSFKCQMAQRSVAFSFSVYADDSLGADRGRFQTGTQTFSFINFIDSQYQIGEFWDYPGSTQIELPDPKGNDPLRCPDVRGPITLTSGRNCHRGGVSPPANVSYGFNMRLHVSEVRSADGQWGSQPVRLTSSILGQSMTPLLWDVDGTVAARNDVSPVLSSPSLDSQNVFAGDLYWFPAMRHGGKANFTFIDGHVKETAAPLAQPEWQWHFIPAAPAP